MCVLLHLLICTALRAHIIVVEALYKRNYYYYYVATAVVCGWTGVTCCYFCSLWMDRCRCNLLLLSCSPELVTRLLQSGQQQKWVLTIYVNLFTNVFKELIGRKTPTYLLTSSRRRTSCAAILRCRDGRQK